MTVKALLYISSASNYNMTSTNTNGRTKNYYVGELSTAFIPDGRGRMVYTNGWIFEGVFANGARYYGKNIYPDGSIYEGEYQNNLPHGKGKFTFHDGGIYDGDFIDNKFWGSGKFTYANGHTREGEWENNQLHGKGKEIYTNGGVYEGMKVITFKARDMERANILSLTDIHMKGSGLMIRLMVEAREYVLMDIFMKET